MRCTVSYIVVSKLTLNNVLKKSKKKKILIYNTQHWKFQSVVSGWYYHISLTLLSLAVGGGSERFPPEFNMILSN